MEQTKTTLPMTEVIKYAAEKAKEMHLHNGGYYETTEDGIYYIKEENGGGAKQFLSTKIEVLGQTIGENKHSWGLFLQWLDPQGNRHQWAIPNSMLSTDGAEFRGALMDRGVKIAPGSKERKLFLDYFTTIKLNKFIHCVDCIGWHDGIFVLPDGVIGNPTEQIVFQSESVIEPVFQSAGTLEEWRENVSRLASGNSRLIFAISVALAAPLIHTGEESGGFHILGGSSSGKTTALNLAASVWGHPDKFSRNWRATTNGLEGLAAVHNDCLLILDELSQLNPKDAGEAAYMLANGQGKTRSTKAGMPKKVYRWRLLFLSAGEESLTGMINSVGAKVNAGQETRMVEIPADAGQNMGMFEELHEYVMPSEFANVLKDISRKYYGTAGRSWLHELVKRYKELPEYISKGISLFIKPEYAGQVVRVARRFGLVALAGELATEVGITGWKKGEATEATHQCFDAWLDTFGTGNREEKAILERIRHFFQSQSDSRLETIGLPASNSSVVIRDKAGYIRYLDNGEKEYLIFQETYKREFCYPYPQKMVTNALKDHGWLKLSSEGKSTDNRSVYGTQNKYYVFNEKVFGEKVKENKKTG